MIALIDCNNFYVSCERVFQPGLVEKPLLVLSNNDGCAIARSEEAKSLGIQMAQPAFLIEDLIHKEDVQVFSSNYTLYNDMSERVMSVIRELVPKTEVYSIDEIFADLSGLQYFDLHLLGKTIREKVMAYTGIPVTVGVAPTKTLAKMANRYAKKIRHPEGVYVAANAADISDMLQFTGVGSIWGIGKQYGQMLQDRGFHTAADLVKAPEEFIRKMMSVTGLRTLQELKGIACIQWEEKPPARKNICTSRSFGKLVSEIQILRQAVAKFTASCGEKLRKENTCARKLQVFIQTNPHRPEDRQYFQSVTLELPVASNHTPELLKHTMKGLGLIFRPGFLYQKAGVMALDLVPAEHLQLALFEGEKKRDGNLMRCIDEVNKSFGKDIVRYGVHDYGQQWKLKQGNLSAQFTTRLNDLPKAG